MKEEVINHWGEKEKVEPDLLGFKILCPFCSQPFNAKMVNTITAVDQGNSIDDTSYGEVRGIIQIRCNRCKKIVYKKEYN